MYQYPHQPENPHGIYIDIHHIWRRVAAPPVRLSRRATAGRRASAAYYASQPGARAPPIYPFRPAVAHILPHTRIAAPRSLRKDVSRFSPPLRLVKNLARHRSRSSSALRSRPTDRLDCQLQHDVLDGDEPEQHRSAVRLYL